LAVDHRGGDDGRILRVDAADGDRLAPEIQVAIALAAVDAGPKDNLIAARRRVDRRLDGRIVACAFGIYNDDLRRRRAAENRQQQRRAEPPPHRSILLWLI